MSKSLFAALLTCSALAAAPVIADPGHGRGFYRQPQRSVVVTSYHTAPRAYYTAPRVRYVQPAYRYPPPAVVYAPPAYYHERHHGRHGHHDDDAWKWVAGGALVGAILYGIDH